MFILFCRYSNCQAGQGNIKFFHIIQAEKKPRYFYRSFYVFYRLAYLVTAKVLVTFLPVAQ